MACGTPVVAADASCTPEVVGDAALLVAPYDVEGFGAAMLRVLTDDALARDMRDRGLRAGGAFSWERTATATRAIYEQACVRAMRAAHRHVERAAGGGHAMKIALLSKAMVTGAYQKKAEELARLPGVELTVIVPPAWHEPRVGVQQLEPQFTQGYDIVVTEMRFNGHFHYHYYPAIGKIIRDLRPDVFHIDEEPYNYATYHAMKAGQRVGAKMCFFTYQNIQKRYPPPFSHFERSVYAGVDVGVAANQAALEVIRTKGFQKPSVVIPQFGVDPALYQPGPPQARPANRPPTVGYIGRLVEEKGIQILLDAVALCGSPIASRSSAPATIGRNWKCRRRGWAFATASSSATPSHRAMCRTS